MKKRGKIFKRIVKVYVFLCVCALLFLYLYLMYIGINVENVDFAQEKKSTAIEQTVESEEEKSRNIADVLEETVKCVVGISKIKDMGESIFLQANESTLGIGTGVVVTQDGYILSNVHVTGEKYNVCYITMENSKKYNGLVVWSDKDLDLSIVKIDENNLNYAKLGDSKNIRIGESVYAIGNPIGFEFRRTVTAGIISSKNRSIKIEEDNGISYMSGLIQTDATINPGNSGGPLIYANGDVIGINSIKISSAEGIGFAIPINVVKPVIESFKNSGAFEQASIGVFAYDKDVISYLDGNINFVKGIYVESVIENGAASATDLKKGDIIYSIDGKEINSMNELREYIFTKRPNDEVRLNVGRGRINKEIIVKLRKEILMRKVII